jgi:transcriptional regulator GlxA family with amidase domain
MHDRQRVIAFLVGSPGDLINLVSISSVFSYPTIDGKPVYVSKILSTQSEREVRGRDGLTLSNCIPYLEYTGPIDTLAIIGGDSVYAPPSPNVLRWIRESAARARRIVSVCTGA